MPHVEAGVKTVGQPNMPALHPSLTSHLCLSSPQERNYFDSADWALSKQGRKPENMAGAAPGPPPTELPPKLEPGNSDALKPRRSSHLGEAEAANH